MHNEIQTRISMVNRAYFAMNKILSSKMLLEITKEKLYTYSFCPIAMHKCKIWPFAQWVEEKLVIFERKVLLKIYGHTQNISGEYERKKNTELERMYNKPNIGKYFKIKRLKWAGYVS